MGTGWIDAVLRMNAQVITAEARFDAQVICLIEAAERGQDTVQEEALLASYRISLDLLRAIQAQFLQSTTVAP